MVRIILRRCYYGFKYALKGELLLSLGQIVGILLPHSIFCFKKYYIFSLHTTLCHISIPIVNIPPSTSTELILEKGNKDTIQALLSCIRSKNPDNAALTLLSFFDMGGELYYVKNEAQLAGYLWLFRGAYRLPLDGGYEDYVVEIKLDPEIIFLSSGHVDESFRRIGIFSKMIDHIKEVSEGQLLYSCTEASNEVSLAAHYKQGFRTCGHIHFLRFFSTGWFYFVFPGKRSKLYKILKGRRVSILFDRNSAAVS